MVLDTNVDNFFAESEQIAFCPAITVPGATQCNQRRLRIEQDVTQCARHSASGSAGLQLKNLC
jgi:catalase